MTATCVGAEDAVRGIISNTSVDTEEIFQSADIARSGNSDAPDLVSVTTSADDADLDADTVIFTFDEAIDSPNQAIANAARFHLSYSHCTPPTVSSTELAVNCDVTGDFVEADDENTDLSDRQVLVTFPTGSINDMLVGAFVEAGAVDETATANLANDPDAVVIDQELLDSGDVLGPQLLSVEAVIDNTASGSFQDYEVTFTFDRDIDDATLTAADFKVWFDVDGETDVLAMSDCDVDSDTTVVCTDDDDESDIGNAVVGSVAAGAVDSDETFSVDEGELGVTMPSPEGSAGFDAPGFPDEED
jgi:hypothetical protein